MTVSDLTHSLAGGLVRSKKKVRRTHGGGCSCRSEDDLCFLMLSAIALLRFLSADENMPLKACYSLCEAVNI